MITKRLFGDEGPTLAGRLGSAAGSVTAVQTHPELRFDGPVQLARSSRYVETIAQVLPALQPRLDEVLRGLERLYERAVGRPRPIHGAPHPEQWLDDDGQLGLIDFDGFAGGS